MLGLLYAFQLSFLFHCFRLFSPVRLYSLLMPPSVTGRRRGRFFYALLYFHFVYPFELEIVGDLRIAGRYIGVFMAHD